MTLAQGIAWGRAQEGRGESPPGSNRVFVWDDIARAYGYNLQGSAWCGGFVLDVALHAGVKLPLQFVSVSYLETWARARGRWHTNPSGIRAGDAVVLFAHGRHVEFAAADGTSAGYWSLGGNTSEANQWNGGSVRYQHRPASAVVGYARLTDLYPGAHATPTATQEDDMFVLRTKGGPGVAYLVHGNRAAALPKGYQAQPGTNVVVVPGTGAELLKNLRVTKA